MIKVFASTILGLWIWAVAVLAETVDGQETYDLLFRNGTLDAVDRNSELVYRRTLANRLAPDADAKNTGDIAVMFDEGDMARIEFRQDDKQRALGQFPATVGNPMIMYFYESVIRDMSSSAGGSPFYIRNRVKEALVQPSEVELGEAEVGGETVETKTIRLEPFAGDPNRARMRGFGDLVLTVTMSDAVPGWYVSLVAEAEAYRSVMSFDRLEAGQ
ncbi:MAG: hypothetical protein AAFV87_02040 [Pseudomonadota bacterium]